ncbi:nuclear transport factor 2 family protein [Paucibacter sp. DJ1R-11]|uniref:nuclear transport factor 2 family protein n=1 Tax=Paucibacter sp. DJ1R-11 TaxID=2893556 RepID=UPI0021E3CE9C|nr:nuclear transport factor 2 family protein [Paucibacter sp. DJ1R-11]MCV2363283.1 nuclear transport factor 2 family protein [Paucibacter sp. DJ1R-11]
MMAQDRSPSLLELLRQQEQALHEPGVRRDGTALRCLLHAEFTEIGRSGRRYDLQQMLSLLLSEEPDGAPTPPRIHAQDFELQVLAPDLALLLYRSAHIDAQKQVHRHSRRSSLWQHVGQVWQMRFHQGTACDTFDLIHIA